MAWAGLDDELSMRWDVINQNHAKIGKLSKSRTARRERTRRNHKIKDPREFYGRYLLGPGGGSDSPVTAAAPGRERTSVSPKCQLDINALTTALVAIDLSASQILCCPLAVDVGVVAGTLLCCEREEHSGSFIQPPPPPPPSPHLRNYDGPCTYCWATNCLLPRWVHKVQQLQGAG